jgi:hypothetical protein
MLFEIKFFMVPVAGNGAATGAGGDGGPATAAQLNNPQGVTADNAGNIYISDNAGTPDSNNVRKVNAAGIITDYAGTGAAGYSGDGCPPLSANLNGPTRLAVDTAGNLYICDVSNRRVRKISPNHAPHFTGGHSQSITICENITDSINSLLGVIDSNLYGSDTWSIVTAPGHGTVVASYTATSLGDTMIPTGLYYTPTSGYTGIDSFKVQVMDCVGMADTTTIHVTINAAPVAITGVSAICAGFTGTLADLTSGGTWSSSNVTLATIGTGSGTLTGVVAGTDTISYTLGTGCGATAIVTVNAAPTAIMGTASVCTGQTTVLSDAITGGTWSSSSTGIATVGSSTGIVTGESPGIATVAYTLTGGCSVNAAVTVNSLPTSISGSALICGGSTTNLSDAITGGTWSSSNATVASVGIISGLVM